MNRPVLLLFALAVGFTPAFAATRFWVAPTGNDAAPGSRERPFATLARARNAVRSLARDGRTEDVEVRLRGGIYALAETLELTADDAGGENFSVTYRAEPGEKAAITGSAPISGHWEPVPGETGLWVMALPRTAASPTSFRSLFRDGRSLPRARAPKQGFWKVLAVDPKRQTLTLNAQLPAAWSRLTGVELNTTAWWHFNRQPVAEISGDHVTAVRPIGTDASSRRISPESHSRVWLENALAFADTPGEWFLDAAASRLYYRAAAGEDPNRVTFAAPRLDELVVVRGEPRRLARNIHFVDLEFAETDWSMPTAGRLGVQAGAFALDRSRVSTPDAALRFSYAAGASVEGCKFRDLGDGAVAFEIGSRNCALRRNEFTRVGSDTIQVGRMPEYTGDKHPLHRDYARSSDWVDQQDPFPSALAIWRHDQELAPEAPSEITISDNSIIGCGTIDLGSVAIFVGYANHVTVEHNLLRDLPYTGISVGWRWAPGLTNCHSNLIAGNRIEQVMQQAGDGAGIYLMGEQPGTRVVENFVTGSGGNYWSHGIYTDEFSDHMEITGNYVGPVADHSLFMHKNGPHQNIHANNGETGPTAITGGKGDGAFWSDFSPVRLPPDLSRFGPRPPPDRS